MEQNSGDQNKNDSFYKRNMVSIIIAVIVVVGVVYFSLQKKNDQPASSDQNSQQQANTDPSPTPAPTDPAVQVGNVTATGTLVTSDDLQKGNLMVQGSSSKIYINTKRDFSSMLNQQVSLEAQGTTDSFVFLGLSSTDSTGTVAGTDTTNQGSTTDSSVTDSVSFSGMLMTSDNAAKGNYVINSGNSKVYLQTVHDYSAMVNSQVSLTATGTINSFTGASIAAKS